MPRTVLKCVDGADSDTCDVTKVTDHLAGARQQNGGERHAVAYDAKGELTQITDPLGRITKLSFTPAGLVGTITDAQQNVTSYEYDLRGNRTAVVDAMQNRTTFAYDTGKRLTTITYPDTTAASHAQMA